MKEYFQDLKDEIQETLKNLKQLAKNENDCIVLEEFLLLFDADLDC